MRRKLVLIGSIVLLVFPVLACGIPFPAGPGGALLGEVVCGADEAEESCALRGDAYALMADLDSARVTDLDMKIIMAVEEDPTMGFAGEYVFQVNPNDDALGAYVQGYSRSASPSQDAASITDVEFVYGDGVFYYREDGAAPWYYDELDDTDDIALALLLGLWSAYGTELDIFNLPQHLTVTTEPDTELNGQVMHVQTLEIDLLALMLNTEGELEPFVENGMLMMGVLGLDDEGITPDDVYFMTVMLQPFVTEHQATRTIYIGAEDGYIHYVEETYHIVTDTSMINPDDPALARLETKMRAEAIISDHNVPVEIVIPEDAELKDFQFE